MCFIGNDKVILKTVDEVDRTLYKQYINSYDRMKYLATAKYPKCMAELDEYLKSFVNNSGKMFFSIFNHQDRYIGNITFSSIDWVNKKAEIGLFIGDENYKGRGYGKASVYLCCEYAFHQLNMNKVSAGVVAGNVPSMKLFESIGFRKEGELRAAFFVDNLYLSEIRYGLLKEEFES